MFRKLFNNSDDVNGGMRGVNIVFDIQLLAVYSDMAAPNVGEY